jgi:uncharacterized membrane protein YbhN (UPF0104 family)
MRKKVNINFDKIFRYLLFVIPIGVTVNVVFALSTTNRDGMEYLSSFKLNYLFWAALLSLAPLAINSLRLGVWTRFLGNPLSFAELLRISAAYELGSAVTPTSGGGGYIKLGMLVQKGFTVGQATSLMTIASVEHITFYSTVIFLIILVTAAFQLPIFDKVVNEVKKSGVTFQWAHILLMLVVIAFLGILLKKIFWKKYRGKIKKVWEDFIGVYRLVLKTGKYQFLLNVFLSGLTSLFHFRDRHSTPTGWGSVCRVKAAFCVSNMSSSQ